MRGIKAGFVAACVFALFALAGCATDTSTNMKSGIDENADWALMSKITQDARLRGHQIVWVHPPQKKQSAKPSSQ